MSTAVSPVPLPVPTPADRVYGCTRLCVVEFGGADPTGATDSTAAIQKCIDALPAKFGGEVHVPAGTYLVDAVTSINLRSNMWFHMEPGAVLKVKPNDQPHYGVLTARGVDSVLISGGTVEGDRDQHTYTPQKVASQSTHEWGHALRIYSGTTRITVRDMTLKDVTGDGISMDGAAKTAAQNDIFIKNLVISNSRRQGISIGRVVGVVIQGCDINNVNGTLPMCGIDIEPEHGFLDGTRQIYIDGCHIHHNKANAILGLERGNVDTPVKEVQVTNCILDYNGACGIYALHIQGLEVFNNQIAHNGQTGLMIGPNCSNVHVAENTFGFNYTRGGAGIDRKDITVFGPPPKGREADILIRNDATQNDIGRNYFT